MSLLSDLKRVFRKEFVLTNQGRVGKFVEENPLLHNLSISFGSFNPKGEWIENRRVTISNGNVVKFISKHEAAKILNDLYKS